MRKASELSPHLTSLDMLRGIAILLVVWFHTQAWLLGEDLTADPLQPTRPHFVSLYGWTGVHLFFIISGFVIHFGYLKRGNSFSWVEYFRRRFWRIYPPYLLVLLLLTIWPDNYHYYFQTSAGVIDFLRHAFLVHNFWDGSFFTINPAFWSLAVEVQLYLLYPILVRVSDRTGMDKLLFISACISFLCYFIPGLKHTQSPALSGLSTLYYLFTWVCGAWLAQRYFDGSLRFHPLLFASSLVGFAIMIAGKLNVSLSWLHVPGSTLAWLSITWIAVSKQWSAKGLGQILLSIGLISYSIYLIHEPLLPGLVEYFTRDGWQLSSISSLLKLLLQLLPVFLIIFLIAKGLFEWVEKPFNAIGHKRSKSHEPQTMVQSSQTMLN